MISRNEFDAYNLAVDKIGKDAASNVESSVLNWCRQNPDASVAEKREAAKLIMEGYVQGYDDVASEFAAEWYDHRAKSEGISLDRAITMAVYSPEKSDAVARYQAKKLSKGGDSAFAKACGEYARNDALRSLNETIIANVGRDKDKGARFARVPTGFETCTFCLMLASRGAVYHTRKTAGEWKHFHRGCDCKVVPSFEDEPLAEVVEGVDPMDLYDRWKLFREIDEIKGLTIAEKDARKRATLDWSVTEGPGWSTSVFGRLDVVEADIDAPLPTGTASASSATGRFKSYSLPSGRRFLFRVDMDPSKQDMTPERLLSLYEKVPDHIKARMQKTIYVVDYANPFDSYWEKKYRKFPGSYATGGDEITFWAYTGHDDAHLVRTLCHETGHMVDAEEAPSGKNFSSGKTWDDAITSDYRHSKKTYPTKYAANSLAEDFAESVALYTVDSVNFRRNFPNRATILDSFFGGGDGVRGSTS